jgi:hypothetical protein
MQDQGVSAGEERRSPLRASGRAFPPVVFEAV